MSYVFLKASKMEARFAALEQRLLKDQEEKHAALVELLVKLHNPEDGGEVSRFHSHQFDSLGLRSGGQAAQDCGGPSHSWS